MAIQKKLANLWILSVNSMGGSSLAPQVAAFFTILSKLWRLVRYPLEPLEIRTHSFKASSKLPHRIISLRPNDMNLSNGAWWGCDRLSDVNTLLLLLLCSRNKFVFANRSNNSMRKESCRRANIVAASKNNVNGMILSKSLLFRMSANTLSGRNVDRLASTMTCKRDKDSCKSSASCSTTGGDASFDVERRWGCDKSEDEDEDAGRIKDCGRPTANRFWLSNCCFNHREDGNMIGSTGDAREIIAN